MSFVFVENPNSDKEAIGFLDYFIESRSRIGDNNIWHIWVRVSDEGNPDRRHDVVIRNESMLYLLHGCRSMNDSEKWSRVGSRIEIVGNQGVRPSGERVWSHEFVLPNGGGDDDCGGDGDGWNRWEGMPDGHYLSLVGREDLVGFASVADTSHSHSVSGSLPTSASTTSVCGRPKNWESATSSSHSHSFSCQSGEQLDQQDLFPGRTIDLPFCQNRFLDVVVGSNASHHFDLLIPFFSSPDSAAIFLPLEPPIDVFLRKGGYNNCSVIDYETSHSHSVSSSCSRSSSCDSTTRVGGGSGGTDVAGRTHYHTSTSWLADPKPLHNASHVPLSVTLRFGRVTNVSLFISGLFHSNVTSFGVFAKSVPPVGWRLHPLSSMLSNTDRYLVKNAPVPGMVSGSPEHTHEPPESLSSFGPPSSISENAGAFGSSCVSGASTTHTHTTGVSVSSEPNRAKSYSLLSISHKEPAASARVVGGGDAYGWDMTSNVCNGISFSNASVCSSRGACVANDTCLCEPGGWCGQFCQHVCCYGLRATDPQACSLGTCVGPNLCNCSLHQDGVVNDTELLHAGPKCTTPMCFGFLANTTQVCSSQGTCVSPHHCECHAGWTGSVCDVWTCDSVSSLVPGVCNGHVCESMDTCNCSKLHSGVEKIPEYAGSNCEVPVCFGLSETDPHVCSGDGRCVAPDVCQCYVWGDSDERRDVDCSSIVTSFPYAAVVGGICGSIGFCVILAIVVIIVIYACKNKGFPFSQALRGTNSNESKKNTQTTTVELRDCKASRTLGGPSVASKQVEC